MWIHYERLHDHNKAKHNKTVCIFLGIYSVWVLGQWFNVFLCLDTLLHAWHVASNASPVGRVQAVCHVRSQYRIKRPYRVYVFLGCVSIPVMTISHVMTCGTMDGNRYARTSAHATGSLSFMFLLWVDACRFSDLLRGYHTASGVQAMTWIKVG